MGVNFNFPRPQSPSASGGGNQLRAYDVSNGFNLHWLGLDLSYGPDPIGGTINLRFGPSAAIYGGADVAHGLENVKQAYVTLKPGGDEGRFSLDFGKFDTIIGAEVADSQLNLDYTRGVVYWYAQPLFHTGFRAEVSIVPELSIRGLLVNGWNDTVDNNAGKTGAAQLVLEPAKQLTAYLGYLFGPEQADTGSQEAEGANGRFKHLVDLIVDIQPTDFFRVLVNGDFGAEKRPGADHALWYGVSVGARVAPLDFLGIGLRGEIYRDEDGWTTGVGEPLSVYTGTLTVDMSPVKYFTTMLDVRVDGASRELFQRGADETAPLQVTATLGAIVKTP